MVKTPGGRPNLGGPENRISRGVRREEAFRGGGRRGKKTFWRFGTVSCCTRRERLRTKGNTNNAPSNAGLFGGLPRQHRGNGDADGSNWYTSRGIGGEPFCFGGHGCKATYINQETNRAYQCSEKKGRSSYSWRAEHRRQQFYQLQPLCSGRTFGASSPKSMFLRPKEKQKQDWLGNKSYGGKVNCV